MEQTISTGLITDDSNLSDLQCALNVNSSNEAREVRNEFVGYFNNESSLPFQVKFVEEEFPRLNTHFLKRTVYK